LHSFNQFFVHEETLSIFFFSVSRKHLQEKFQEFLDVANTTYKHLSILNNGESASHFQQRLTDEAGNIYQAQSALNYQTSKEKCESVLQTHLQNLEEQFDQKYSKLEGKGVQHLFDDIKQMKAEYKEKELGPARDKVYADFEKVEVSAVSFILAIN
jgi:hypothetical protein